MFGKLVKHEFRATARIIPFVYLVTIFLAIVHIIMTKLHFDAASKISLALMIMMCVAQVVVASALVVWRYYKNMYSNESYLTHTLPVKPSLLLWSKLLVGFIWTLCSFLIGIAVSAVVLITEFMKSADQLAEISKGYHSLLLLFGLQNQEAVLWIIVIAWMIVMYVMFLAEAYFAITVGSLSKMHSLGIGGPILVYFAEYIALQVVGTLTILFFPLGLEMSTTADGALGGFKLVTQNMFSSLSETINTSGAAGADSGIIGIGYYILIPFIAVGLLCWTAHIIKKHTSVK